VHRGGGVVNAMAMVPERLRAPIGEWLVEAIRLMCADVDETASVQKVVDAVHLHDAFLTGTLTLAQLADSIDRAVFWFAHKKQPELAYDLSHLRDRVRAISPAAHEAPTAVMVDRKLCELLRVQTLAVFEFVHHVFEDARELPPDELSLATAVFRDGIAVLDTIGLFGNTGVAPVRVRITPAHRAQLERRRVDIEMSIADRLDGRRNLKDAADLAEADKAIAVDRRALCGLQRLLSTDAGEL
jgi:hypothetical protein